jgi:hypothetical protein
MRLPAVLWAISVRGFARGLRLGVGHGRLSRCRGKPFSGSIRGFGGSGSGWWKSARGHAIKRFCGVAVNPGLRGRHSQPLQDLPGIDADVLVRCNRADLKKRVAAIITNRGAMFEVASIKPCVNPNPARSGNGKPDPGRLSVDCWTDGGDSRPACLSSLSGTAITIRERNGRCLSKERWPGQLAPLLDRGQSG